MSKNVRRVIKTAGVTPVAKVGCLILIIINKLGRDVKA